VPDVTDPEWDSAETFYAPMSLLREMLDYATEVNDVDLVSRIITKHQPRTVDQLKEIHSEYRGITPPLQDGML
jgi:hypothetical protein